MSTCEFTQHALQQLYTYIRPKEQLILLCVRVHHVPLLTYMRRLVRFSDTKLNICLWTFRVGIVVEVLVLIGE